MNRRFYAEQINQDELLEELIEVVREIAAVWVSGGTPSDDLMAKMTMLSDNLP